MHCNVLLLWKANVNFSELLTVAVHVITVSYEPLRYIL